MLPKSCTGSKFETWLFDCDSSLQGRPHTSGTLQTAAAMAIIWSNVEASKKTSKWESGVQTSITYLSLLLYMLLIEFYNPNLLLRTTSFRYLKWLSLWEHLSQNRLYRVVRRLQAHYKQLLLWPPFGRMLKHLKNKPMKEWCLNIDNLPKFASLYAANWIL